MTTLYHLHKDNIYNIKLVDNNLYACSGDRILSYTNLKYLNLDKFNNNIKLDKVYVDNKYELL